MKIRRLSSAETEYVEAAEFYLAESPQAAERFATEVEEAVADIINDALRNRRFEGKTRRKLLKKFPYSIIYLACERVRNRYCCHYAPGAKARILERTIRLIACRI